MKCLLLCDNTLSLPISDICDLLNKTFKSIEFVSGSSQLHFASSNISYPSSYDKLSDNVKSECANYDLSFLLTNIQYDNKYFFEFSKKIVILSFSHWNLLTDLPMTNGLVYFITSILCDQRKIGETHQDHTGCINDFWWDKKEIDVGMRAAFICSNCKTKFTGNQSILIDIENALDFVSQSSRKGENILEFLESSKLSNSDFDVFLCHNSHDKSTIRDINEKFKERGIKTWFDEEQIEPGSIWQEELEKQINSIKNVCVFVGESGRGPWQDMEIRAFLSEFVKRKCRVIPVILSNATDVPDLPIFLHQLMWVDLRKEFEKNIDRLINTLNKNN